MDNINFGPGVELLMNDKIIDNKKKDGENIEVLELELNELSDISGMGATRDAPNKTGTNDINKLFESPNKPLIFKKENEPHVKVDDNITIIGEKTIQRGMGLSHTMIFQTNQQNRLKIKHQKINC